MVPGSMAGREVGSAEASGTASSGAFDDLLEGAQCLWEASLPRAVRGGCFEGAREELGMAELRGRLREPALLAACLEGWQTAEERHYDGVFDWGYVPLFLESCIGTTDAAIVPGWQAKLAEALERAGFPALSPPPDRD